MTGADTILVPLSDADWPEALADLQGGFTGSANVYRTMAHNPALLRAWQDLRAHLVTQNSLGPELLEVVVLRIGYRLRSEYEWRHHIVRARAVGFSDARIVAMTGPVDAMDAGDALLAGAVDSLIDTARMDHGLRHEIVKTHGACALFDLMATVGFYSTLAFILNTCETPVDSYITDALAARPLTPEPP